MVLKAATLMMAIGVIVAVSVWATADHSGLPVSYEMSPAFKAAAQKQLAAVRRTGVCFLPSDVKAENTADNKVRRLFDRCTDIDSEKRSISRKLITDDLKSKYNNAADEQGAIIREIEALLK